MAERLYFAYGSNINLEQMAVRCPAAQVVGPAVLEGYEDGKLTVRWNGEPLTLEKSEVAQVRLRVEF